MREPPPLSEPPSLRYGYLFRGLIMLVGGMVSEWLMRPIVPWTYVPGTLVVVTGVGIAVAIFDRYRPDFASIAYFAVAVGVFGLTYLSQTSILPLFLYTAAFDLTRFALRVQIEE